MGKLPPANKSDASLNGLLQKTGLWRASSIDFSINNLATGKQPLHNIPGATGPTLPSTGFSALDNELPGSGWPVDGVTEFLLNAEGIGEFRLLTPALARLTHAESRWLLLVCPPYIPYPPALAQMGVNLTRVLVSQPRNPKDYLWVLEKALSSKSCSAVLAWPGNIQEKQIRRLQLASKAGRCWNILFRPEHAAKNASPAELRIRLRPSRQLSDNAALQAKILKRRGRWESQDIVINLEDQLHRPMPDFSEMTITPVQDAIEAPSFSAVIHRTRTTASTSNL